MHVRHDVRGQGVGRALAEALFPLALALGKHVMIGGIDAANHTPIRFHERLGFERVAHFREAATNSAGGSTSCSCNGCLTPPALGAHED